MIALHAAGTGASGAHLYVTLEPCAHHGRTPPCVDAIIAAGISKVFIGTSDPNPLVAGRGVKKLQDAGIEVMIGVCKEDCDLLHAPFKKWITEGIPWVSLKGAMTLDGCLSTAAGHSKWITGKVARSHVHQLRASVDAILIGAETARRDRPQLNVRLVDGQDPRPVILSRMLLIPNDLPCIHSSAILVHGKDTPKDRRQFFLDKGCELIEVPFNKANDGLCIKATLKALGQRDITHILIEGGGKIHGDFLNQKLADDLHLYIAPKIIGRGKPLFNLPSVAKIPQGMTLQSTSTQRLGDDIYLYGRISG